MKRRKCVSCQIDCEKPLLLFYLNNNKKFAFVHTKNDMNINKKKKERKSSRSSR